MVEQVELALSRNQTSQLTHGELAVVSDLPWCKLPWSSSRHSEGQSCVIGVYHARGELYVGSDRVTDEGSKH